MVSSLFSYFINLLDCPSIFQEVASKLENDALGSSTGLSALKQLDKKKKLTDDAFMKANEAETTYKSCVIEANSRQNELEKTKVPKTIKNYVRTGLEKVWWEIREILWSEMVWISIRHAIMILLSIYIISILFSFQVTYFCICNDFLVFQVLNAIY